MKVKCFGAEIEPVSFLGFLFACFCFVNLALVTVAGFVVFECAIQIFNAPVRLFRVKRGR